MASPDWPAIYRGTYHVADRDAEPVAISRESARWALQALNVMNGRCAYENTMAAAGELREALK